VSPITDNQNVFAKNLMTKFGATVLETGIPSENNQSTFLTSLLKNSK
jgi:hypothetical protein